MLVGTFTLGFSQSNYYNSYQQSINDINWKTLAADLLLSTQQKNELFALNNQYTNYDSWNRVYNNQPERWTTDRYTAIERILGTEKYKKFKTKYYKGKNPVAVYNSNKNNYKPYTNNRKFKNENDQGENGNHQGHSHKGGKGHR